MKATEGKAKAKDGLSGPLQGLLDGYVGEGLIPVDWKPLGDSEKERRGSIHAKAYTTWLRTHADDCANRHPETARAMFLNRHDASWKPPDPTPVTPVEGLETPTDVEGFHRPTPALPTGDLWQDYTQPAEDEPPPMET